MPIFLVVSLLPTTASLDAAVEAYISNEADRHLLQGGRGWLIHFQGTTVELSKLLTVTGQQPGEPAGLGSVLITLVSSYYGRAPTETWEWMQTRTEK